MNSPQRPIERPNGSFVKHTRAGFDGRPVVSILVREDDPNNPHRPDRWRPVEGNGRWVTWEQMHATGSVEPLFSADEMAAAIRRQQCPRGLAASTGPQQSRPGRAAGIPRGPRR